MLLRVCQRDAQTLAPLLLHKEIWLCFSGIISM